jgi:pimeloyl-ACP methyl ester carboxylesterase
MQVLRRRVHLPSLERNPLGQSPERDVVVFIPTLPRDLRRSNRLPVVYFLHGYGRSLNPPTISSKRDGRRHTPLVQRLLFAPVFRRLITFERIDADVRAGRLPPFILVQPDGSLHLEQTHGRRNPDGSPLLKGNFYSDSPFTGNHASAVFADLVARMDAELPTHAVREARALVGVSMGGYGAILGATLYPDTFGVVAALSPAVCCLDVIGHHMVAPYRRLLAGQRSAAEEGRQTIEDILDSCDMVYSRDRPLLPSLRHDNEGQLIDYDEETWERWEQWDLARMIRNRPAALDELGIAHDFEIYNDRLSGVTSPHMVGIAGRIGPALHWAVRRMAARTGTPTA